MVNKIHIDTLGKKQLHNFKSQRLFVLKSSTDKPVVVIVWHLQIVKKQMGRRLKEGVVLTHDFWGKTDLKKKR